MTKTILTGTIGSCLTAIASTLSTNEVLRIIEIVFSIIGMILTFIVMPLINHFTKAKANDGKIDANEVKQGLEILADGSEKVAEEIKQRKDK